MCQFRSSGTSTDQAISFGDDTGERSRSGAAIARPKNSMSTAGPVSSAGILAKKAREMEIAKKGGPYRPDEASQACIC